MYVYFVYSPDVCACVHVYLCTCGGQKRTSCVLLRHLPPRSWLGLSSLPCPCAALGLYPGHPPVVSGPMCPAMLGCAGTSHYTAGWGIRCYFRRAECWLFRGACVSWGNLSIWFYQWPSECKAFPGAIVELIRSNSSSEAMVLVRFGLFFSAW